jgi:DNA-binding LacI/PurR family transcriptional regulator
MSSRSHVTIRDVAALAGVSHQTVSRVINGSERVLPETKARVEAAITELDYRPNAIARSMAKGRSGILACIAPNLTDYTFASLINGAEIEARQQGFFLLSASAPDEDTFAALMGELITSRRSEGVLVINPYADNRYSHLPEDFPVVFAGARPREDATNSVALDDEAVGQAATNHLLQLGHRAIGLITGPLAEDCSQDRCLGYEAALRAANIAPQAEWVMEGDWSARSGYEALMALAARGDLPDAIFAQNDQMAVGVLRAATDLGVPVPDQLSVIGVDDIPMSPYFEPPLTTIRQDFLRIGQEAARLLIRALNQPFAPRQHLRLPAELIVRRSTSAR